MMHDEEAASPRWKLNPKKFRPQYEVHKIFRVGGNNQGRSGFRKQQKNLGLTNRKRVSLCVQFPISEWYNLYGYYLAPVQR